MKLNLLSGLILSSLLAVVNLSLTPRQSLAESAQEICRNALIDATNVIENGRNATVVSLRGYHLSTKYQTYPREAPFGLLFVLDGPAANDVMASGQFMTILANRVVDACPSFGLVEFGMNSTSWRIPFGRMNGQLVAFDCIDMGLGRSLRWGENYCG